MRPNDPEYKKRIEMISTIPSNKIDDVPLKNISDEVMDQFNEKHLRDLQDQVNAYDLEELQAVSEAIVERCWIVPFNALGEYFNRIYKQKEAIKTINQ